MNRSSSLRNLIGGLRLPILASPMFLVSNPEMVIAQCTSGIVGSFPALNARPQEELSVWLDRIEAALQASRDAGGTPAPFAVNLVIRPGAERFEADLQTCVRHQVPIIITSLGDPARVAEQVHAYGGLVLHDVTSARHARRALAGGADGLILVCAGAGGHAGALSPFALVGEVRQFFDGPIVLGGAITDGRAVLAAQTLGADMAYMGTRFIATQESGAVEGYKNMLVASSAGDIVYTPHFSGIPANYLKPSIVAAGLDPDNLPAVDTAAVRVSGDRHRRWKDIWGAGQGVGGIADLPRIADLVDRLEAQYRDAEDSLRQRLAASAAARGMPA